MSDLFADLSAQRLLQNKATPHVDVHWLHSGLASLTSTSHACVGGRPSGFVCEDAYCASCSASANARKGPDGAGRCASHERSVLLHRPHLKASVQKSSPAEEAGVALSGSALQPIGRRVPCGDARPCAFMGVCSSLRVLQRQGMLAAMVASAAALQRLKRARAGGAAGMHICQASDFKATPSCGRSCEQGTPAEKAGLAPSAAVLLR